jgi:DNA invertase Pin-like site-specific DNA recombinase
MLDLDFFGFTPSWHVEIEKEKKTRRRMVGIQKRKKKGSEKGRKKNYCERPYYKE